MKKIILTIVVLLLGSINLYAADISQKKAELIVQNTADDALSFLNTQKGDAWSEKEVEEKFSEILYKYFNVDYIAKASLGNYWKKANDIEKKEYLEIFKKNIVKIYTIRFKEYTDQVVEIQKSSTRGRGDIIVFSKIVSGEGSQPPLNVEWRVRLQKDGSYRIIDLTVAGVSMLITQRNEYKAIIEQNGGKVRALIDELSNTIKNN